MVSIFRQQVPPNAPNPQLAGLIRSAPNPPTSQQLSDGTTGTLDPNTSSFTFGGLGNQFPTITSGSVAGGGIVVGGGITPANGAQPAAPGTTAATPTVATSGTPTAVERPEVTAPTPGATVGAGTSTTRTAPVATATSSGGFGRKDRDAPMVAKIGAATFSFPSFNASAKSLAAPSVQWGPGWTQVKRGDQWYMKHANGAKAVPALEYRITPTPLDKATPISVANGWGKKFPDGTILIFDRDKGPYKLDPSGKKSPVKPGMHTFGGVRVRLFEASVVRVLEPSGAVTVFDSRGNVGAGSPRSHNSAALTAAGGGASNVAAPSKGGGPGKGSLVGGGGTPMTKEQLAASIAKMTETARAMVSELQAGGTLDAGKLQELQQQLGTLPSGILQAVGGGQTMTGDGTTIGLPASEVAGARGDANVSHDAPPGATTAGGATMAAPDAGAQANETVQTLAAGATKTMSVTVPGSMMGKSYRFAQLPEELQAEIAKGLGSTEGPKALEADTLVRLGEGRVTFPEGGKVHLRHVGMVTGGGPGEDLAFTTMRPVRQPLPGAVRGGGASGQTTAAAAHSHGAGATVAHRPAAPTTSRPVAAGGRGQLFAPGAHLRLAAAAGMNGVFTFGSLPRKIQAAIGAYLSKHPEIVGPATFAGARGIDRFAQVVVANGDVSFPNGLRMASTGSAPRPPVSGGGGATGLPPASGGTGATTQPVGHDANRPPVSGGGGAGPLRPGTAPPVPDGAANSAHHHPGM